MVSTTGEVDVAVVDDVTVVGPVLNNIGDYSKTADAFDIIRLHGTVAKLG